jgi:hypothetical protein
LNGVNVKRMHFNIYNQQKNDHHQKQFEKDLVLYIAKELIPLFFGEFPFLRRLVLRQNPCTRFPSSVPWCLKFCHSWLKWWKRNSSRNLFNLVTLA